MHIITIQNDLENHEIKFKKENLEEATELYNEIQECKNGSIEKVSINMLSFNLDLNTEILKDFKLSIRDDDKIIIF